ncbi:MAG: ABC transporter permease [candidate division Zixibacteria bacterium]|jgi:putative ABC transport system permease protein|nr:ABC transporter permease [candidate division Zixibacteria bacterium]
MRKDYGQILRLSFDSLSAHKLRSFLTMLGVIIGVAAVVSMLSIGEGAEQEILEQISILGINNIIINAKVPDEAAGSEEGLQRSPGLSLADGDNIESFYDLVGNVVPQRFEAVPSVRFGPREAEVRVVATTPEFVYSSSIEVEYGRFIHQIDMETFAQVCVLGAKAKKALFAFSDPIGQSVRIGLLDFTVVGVMADKYIGRGKVEGLELRNFNEDVYIPYSTAAKKFDRRELSSERVQFWTGGDNGEQRQAYNTPEIDQLTVTVTQLDYVPAVTKLVERIMQRRHGGITDYEIVVPESLLRQSQKTQQIFNIVMGAIAGLSLLVGGIGIMNIMLATVLERTREIGVRRAVGATQMDILRQFLFEAVMICLLGCTIGLALGLVIAQAITFYAGWPTIVSVSAIVLAVGVSTAVGLVFGIYPARKAARLDVIEALRYE